MHASEQTSYVYTFPTNVDLNSQTGRAMLAKVGDGELPSELFHYDANGKPCTGKEAGADAHLAAFPLVRIRAYRNRLTVTGIGPDKGALLDDHGFRIARLLKDRAGLFCKTERQIETVSFQPSDEPVRYVMHQFVHRVKLRNRDKRMQLLSPDAQQAVIARRIEYDLLRQADALELNLPYLSSLLPTKSIRFDEVKATRVCEGKTGKVCTSLIPRVTFLMFARLTGNWAAGGLMSRGHGRIWYDMPR